MNKYIIATAFALVFGATAFAQTSGGPGTAGPAAGGVAAGAASPNGQAGTPRADLSKGESPKAGKSFSRASRSAGTKHHMRHAKKATTHKHAKAVASHKRSNHGHYAKSRHTRSTHAMGAGYASPMTSVDASSRQARMDAAYADFTAGRK